MQQIAVTCTQDVLACSPWKCATHGICSYFVLDVDYADHWRESPALSTCPYVSLSMPHKRILSLWFPRLGAERWLRMARGTIEAPLATVREQSGARTLAALSTAASAAGLRRGQPLRDARAMCPALLTRSADPAAEAAFLASLRRWAGKFSPWVAEAGTTGLTIDLTGCAHLFGGEHGVMEQVGLDCADLGLTVRVGLADTPGAAWALARYGQGQGNTPDVAPHRSGDAIDMEAYATRSRAAKRRHWERGGAAPTHLPSPGDGRDSGFGVLAPAGQTRQALAALPVAALRLPQDTVAQLARLGLRRIDDLAGQPRAALARRFGKDLVMRLDQAFGTAPEPVSPARAPLHFACRLTLPEPIGLTEDVQAGLDRLLPALADRLREKGHGARRVRLQAFRCDHRCETVEVGLARPSANPDRLRPLLALKLDDIDAGPGIDMLRLQATVTEPVHAHQHRGHLSASADTAQRLASDTALDDLIGRIGARIGLEAVTRLHPGDSHLPEKTDQVQAAAWSEPARNWPTMPPAPRPLLLFRPEPLMGIPDMPRLPARFQWRRQSLTITAATGLERIAPEWWLDLPDWRTGQRDYWRVDTDRGHRLWIYFAHGDTLSPGWFCQGRFA